MSSINQRKKIELSSETNPPLHHSHIAKNNTSSVIPCSTLFCHPQARKTSFHEFKLSSKTSNWLDKTDILCWHCAHKFSNSPVYIPANIVPNSSDSYTFDVYGNFCSFACALTYLTVNSTFDSNRQILLLNKLAVDVYELNLPIHPAPPSICLTAFGGHMDINEFRKIGNEGITEIICETPPFTSSSMVIQYISNSVNKDTEKIYDNSVTETKRKEGDPRSENGDEGTSSSRTTNNMGGYVSWNVRNLQRDKKECTSTKKITKGLQQFMVD